MMNFFSSFCDEQRRNVPTDGKYPAVVGSIGVIVHAIGMIAHDSHHTRIDRTPLVVQRHLHAHLRNIDIDIVRTILHLA